MQSLFRRSAIFILLFSLMFPAALSRAQEQGQSRAADPQVLKALTVDEFRAALPEKAEELYMEDFLELKEKGPVTVLDVRSKDSFARRHLKGSVNAPLTDLTEHNLPQLVPDKDAPVVLACDYSFMPVRMLAMTLQAYPLLKASGYTNIHRLNLWANRAGGEMRGEAEQEKLLAFEGTAVKPRE